MTTKEKMIETIMNDPMINIIWKQWILRMVLEKHLQDTTEERECENCKKLQKELDWISFSI